MGEVYVESVLKVMEKLGVKRYCLLGSMYDSIPHTRPLSVIGSASESRLDTQLKEAGVRPIRYSGPTTIINLISQQAAERGIETMALIVRLPHYAQLEEDYNGQHALLSLIRNIYNFSIDLDPIRQLGDDQYRRVSQAVETDPGVRDMVRAMEKSYDEGVEDIKQPEGMPGLSPEIEGFLEEMEKRFESD